MKRNLKIPIPPVTPDPAQGLTDQQVQQRLAAGYGNKTQNKASMSAGQIILQRTFTVFNLLLVCLAVWLLVCGSGIIKLTFLPIAIFNTLIGIIQQLRAKQAVEKLTLVAEQTMRVVRNGELLQVPSALLVRDDIVEFIAGNQICADGILLEGQLYVNESLVTGEADAIMKNPGDSLLSGSFAVAGKGRACLTAVGNDSFAARLSAEAKKNPKVAKPEMIRSLDKLIKVIGFLMIPVGIALFCKELFLVTDSTVRDSAEGTVAALVGMIPNGLYLLTSLALAASALKLSKKRVLVQDMNCIETLARVDVLCVDKTGTITEPGMDVTEILPLHNTDPARLEQVLTGFYRDTEPENDTARAMTARFSGETELQCTHRIPFTSDTKWSAATFGEEGTFVVGAPEFIMGSRYPEIRETAEKYTGSRVLLVAGYDGIPAENRLDAKKLTPLGLVLLSNKIRPTARETFSYFKAQSVAIKVISGDNPATVAETARLAGIENAELFVDATTLETEEALYDAAARYTVFGRVTPEQKRQLIRALKQQGHTVAMTGDGVNDVLAMKEADCAVAMASGAQAASQVARLVLVDSDFAAMPHIVGEGRRVINNIQRAASLFIVKNMFSLGLSMLSLLTRMPYPLETQHMSIISGLTIGIPSFFLAMEPNYERVTGKFLPTVLRRALPGGVTNVLAVMATQACMNAFSLPQDQVSTVCTAVLAVVGMMLLFQVCKPFGTFRKLVWGAMGIALICCFTILGGIFELQVQSSQVLLVLAVLLIALPTVFFIINRSFTLGDKLIANKKSHPA